MERYELEYKDDSESYKCPGCGSHLMVKLKVRPEAMDGDFYLGIYCTDDVFDGTPMNTTKTCQLIDAKYKPLNLLKHYRDDKYFDLLQDAKWYFISEMKKQTMKLEELIFKITALKLKEFL